MSAANAMPVGPGEPGSVRGGPASGGSAASAPREYPSTILFTALELAAILALRPGAAAETAREQLAISGGGPDEVRAGARSLIDRGYLRPDGSPAPGPATVVAHALTCAGEWATVVVADPGAVSPGVIVDADPLHLWISPYPDRTFAVTALRTRYPRAELCASALAYLETHVPSGVSVAAVREGGERVDLVVSRAPDGSWWRRIGGAPPVACSRDEAAAALADGLVDAAAAPAR